MNFQTKKLFSHLVLGFLLVTVYWSLVTSPALAVVNPTSVPNNKVGIHIISATIDEASEAARLVNTNGDWGYITVLAESKDRDVGKWQAFFNYLREKHLIPLVRLATQPEGNYWKRPYDGEETAWADFLDSLVWPTKNRYVIIYNEPNHATEWGNTVDAKNYAQTLNKTIDALKTKSPDFFVLNAGFDASAPQKLPVYQEELDYIKSMNDEVPGIFNKLDGWVSHSYPNPGFIGSPNATGRGTVRTWNWELDTLKSLGVDKILPVFITETGWKHAEGVVSDRSLPLAQTVADYYKKAFDTAWNSDQIVAVTPFLLNYQDKPFDHFSFRKITTKEQPQIDYLSPFSTLQSMPKITGHPAQDYSGKVEAGSIYNTLVLGENYTITLTIKNTGQSIWNEYDQIKLIPSQGQELLADTDLIVPSDQKIEPGQSYAFTLHLKAQKMGIFNVKLNLFHGSTEFSSEPFNFTTEIKSPVVVKVKASLKWKNNFAGEYILEFAGIVSNTVKNIVLDQSGLSDETSVRSILPDNSYDFTLKKPFYEPKTIHEQVIAGTNTLDFGELQPDISSAILHPTDLWQLLPFSN